MPVVTLYLLLDLKVWYKFRRFFNILFVFLTHMVFFSPSLLLIWSTLSGQTYFTESSFPDAQPITFRTRYTVFIKIDVKQCFIPARCQIISGKCWLEKLRFQRGVGAAWGGHSHCCCCWCCWDPRVGNLLITLMHLCSDIILKGVLLLLVSSWTSWSQQSPSTPGEADRGWWQVRNRGRNLP